MERRKSRADMSRGATAATKFKSLLMKTRTRVESTQIMLSQSPFCARVAVAILAIGAGVLSLMADDSLGAAAAQDANAIRPFHVNIPDEALADLRRRVAATSWPDK